MDNQTPRSDQILNSVRQIIEKNLNNEEFTVSDLAKEFGLSRSMLHRKLIRLTGKSATELITEARLAKARELLETNSATVAEVAYMVGFSSPSYFNKVFKKVYRVTPGEVTRKGPGLLTQSLTGNVKGRNEPGWFRRSGTRIFSWVVIFSMLILTLSAVLFIAGIIPSASRMSRTEIKDKSIAVLPFRNDSPENENQYIINGYMAAILYNLSMIRDLRVINRESVEPYRDQPNIQEVIRKFKVGYLLSGSGQKYGDNMRIIVQLTDVNKEIVWSREYDRRISSVEDHTAIQSDIAQHVAEEINAVITPEEKRRIERIPTASLKALDLFQRGMDEFWKFWLYPQQRDAIERATAFFNDALVYDSTFAEAYTGLARNYYRKKFWEEFFTGNFMDSALSLVNHALYYDNQQADAYLIRGAIYMDKDMSISAGQDLQAAIRLNPNSWENYFRIGDINSMDDQVSGLDNYLKAASLNYGLEKPVILRAIGRILGMTGFEQQSSEFLRQALELDGDSVIYYTGLAANENWKGDYLKSIEYCHKALIINSSHTRALDRMAYNHMFLGDMEASYRYYTEMERNLTGSNEIDINDRHRIGYVFWKVGRFDEARMYFDLQKQYCLDMIELGRRHAMSGFAHYDLAGVYAFRGDKERALENLRLFNRRTRFGIWMVTLINDDPLFDSIRDEPEFQQIVRDVETKYQAEHQRIRQWLEENELY